MRKNNRALGSCYEEQAALLLKERGYEILEHNYRSRKGEIDLIGREGGYLVFIEVKFRSTIKNGDPGEAVDARKQRRILDTARYYLLTHGYGENTPCRFDVVAILGGAARLIKDAFWPA